MLTFPVKKAEKRTKKELEEEYNNYLTGNSIVVNVLEAIFRNLFLEEEVSEYKLF